MDKEELKMLQAMYRSIYGAVESYFKDPEHEKAFREWEEKRNATRQDS